ncbi:MAG: hypothetical protein AAFZ01_10755, partial [Pseudomonadota bacterium]
MSIWFASAIALIMLVVSGWGIGRIIMAESRERGPGVRVVFTGAEATAGLVDRICEASVALDGPRLDPSGDAAACHLSITRVDGRWKVSAAPAQVTTDSCAVLTVLLDRSGGEGEDDVDLDDVAHAAAVLVALHTRPRQRATVAAVSTLQLEAWQCRYLKAWPARGERSETHLAHRLAALRDALALCPHEQLQSRIIMLGNLAQVCADLAQSDRVPLHMPADRQDGLCPHSLARSVDPFKTTRQG